MLNHTLPTEPPMEAIETARAHMELFWNACIPARPNHPYLQKHGIQPCGARLHDGKLVIRMHDYSGKIESLLFIDHQTGEEQVQRINSILVDFGFCVIGETTGTDELYIATSFTSAALIHKATGGPVMVIWDPNMIYDAAVYANNKFGEESLSLVLCLEPRHNNDDTLLFFREAACAADATGAMLAFLSKRGRQ